MKKCKIALPYLSKPVDRLSGYDLELMGNCAFYSNRAKYKNCKSE